MIAPIPFGVGVAMETNCGSCLLLDTLYQYGLSISADEVTRYRLHQLILIVITLEVMEITPWYNGSVII